MRLSISTVVLTLIFALASSATAEETPVDFRSEIRPLLSDRCFQCHGPDDHDRQADLRLDTFEGATADLGGHAAIAPESPEKSELIERIFTKDADLVMPPPDSGKKLSDQEASLIRRWIKEGARYEKHWAYEPIKSPTVPANPVDHWSRNPIDRFIIQRLQAESLKPSPQADPVTLIRRLHFDLLGLPPSPAVVGRFVAEQTEVEYARIVDELLDSPHYGERLAIMWLDLVRFADTVGYHGDQDHSISPYRDYIIQSLNEDLPFDQFTREQLAGDLIPNATERQIVASGYNRLLQTSHEGGVQKNEYLAKYSADRVRNFSEVWLGATMGCAECHNHKYDPYTQKDFYSIAAFFADVDDSLTFKGSNSLPTKREPEIEVVTGLDRAMIELLKSEKMRLESLLKTGLVEGTVSSQKQVEARLKQIDQRIAERSKPRRTMITKAAKPRVIRVLSRGDWMDTSGQIVEPSVPGFLPELVTKERSTRLDLARWLVSADHPLTARVFVNRLWKLYFGNGISPSLDDFGAQGEPATHPELLDWLAADFRDHNWKIKRVTRQIVMSSTYRQSSLMNDTLKERDPANRLLARQSRFRLDAELIRDNALAISGLLVLEIGGRSVKPYQPNGYYQHLNFPERKYTADRGTSQFRRGLYTHWQRIFLHPMLKAFDAPSREECTAMRSRSNTPLASLVLLNDPTFVEAARAFAARITMQEYESDADRLEWAFRQCVSRVPDELETRTLLRFLDEERTTFRKSEHSVEPLLRTGQSPVELTDASIDHAAWTSVARVLLNLSETITRN